MGGWRVVGGVGKEWRKGRVERTERRLLYERVECAAASMAFSQLAVTSRALIGCCAGGSG